MAKPRKGWQKVSSKIIHKNPWYALREDEVVQPDGRNGSYTYVDDVESVFVIAVDKGEFVLVGQSRYVMNNLYSWEFIGGTVDNDEGYLTAAKRELEEEAGILAEKWTNLGLVYPNNGISAEKNCIFLAENLQFKESHNEGTEDISMKKVSEDELSKMIYKGEIVCGQTMTAFCKYLIYRDR